MSKIIWAIAGFLAIHWSITTTDYNPSTVQLGHFPIEQYSTDTLIAEENLLLASVNLTFDFLAKRIGQEMFWDDIGNLTVKGINGAPDTIYFSDSWTTPRMVIDYWDTLVGPPSPTPSPIVTEYTPPKGYLDKWSPVATKLMKQYGVAASITMAQAILESSWGKGNNHFGIKCQGRGHHHKKGREFIGEQLHHCMNFHDDSPKDMFRIYENVEESFIAHNTLLLREWDKPIGNYGKIWKEIPRKGIITRRFHKRKGAIYKEVLQDGKMYSFPYYVWMAIELKNEGYATDKHYAEKLVRIIHDNKLLILDETDT